jgi:Flp pilus assembly protein TadG
MVTSRDKRTTHRPRRARDEGYVLVLTALLLLPLVAFTGFAVDLGSWYGRAAQVQRASDAAALAGVQDLPNLPQAILTAKSVAAQNGFTDGVGGITVTVAQVPDPTAKLKVTIRDSAASQFFTKAFKSAVLIERTGTAQYLKPVSMGSPKNFLGTGSLTMQTNAFTENYWLAVSGGCASKENGDRIMTLTDANYNSSANPAIGAGWGSCTGGNTITNTEYDANGYFYAVEFKQNVAGSVAVQIYDASLCSSGSNAGDSGSTGFNTTFQMRDNASFDPLSTNPVGSAIVTGSSCNSSTYQNKWVTLYTINNPTKGVYFVQVKAAGGSGGTNHGSNGFGLRAQVGGTWSACSSDLNEVAGSPFSATCPQVYGYGNLGVYANLAGTQAQFYLAQIGPDYNNKQMELALWDPGEGSKAMQILDPNGNPVPFTWQVMCQNNTSAPCAGETAPTGGYQGTSGSVTERNYTSNCTGGSNYVVPNAIDLWGSQNATTCAALNPQPGGYRGSNSKYSDRLLKLTVQLPADIAAAFGGRQWYKINYYVGSAPTDRTTWSVTIKGAPIRLIPNP